jgi:molybdopterin-guanine dinucleotide biosynthesis protein A
MGVDKASLVVGGEPLAVRLAGLLDQACDEVLIASGDGQCLSWLGRPQVADAMRGRGPMGGLVAGLERARHPLVAVVAVDMPFASPAVLAVLASWWAGEDAVVPTTDRGSQPLHAVYAAGAAPRLREQLEAGRLAVRDALGWLDVRFVGEADWRPADPSGRFALNLNRPEDLAALR